MADDVLGLTAQIVSAHVTKNAVAVEELPSLIREAARRSEDVKIAWTLTLLVSPRLEAALCSIACWTRRYVPRDRTLCLPPGAMTAKIAVNGVGRISWNWP